MKHTNKSISELSSPHVATIASKLKNNALGNIDGTSAIIAEFEPKGKLCPFDRQLSSNNWVNSTKIRYQKNGQY